MSEAVLRATALVKRFGPTTVVSGVDLHVGAGEVVGLVGPNGAGKSTVLRMCLGLLAPDAGTVLHFGLPPGGRPGAVAATFDTCSLIPHLTARQTVDTFSRYAGERTDAALVLRAVGVDESAWDRRVSSFSHGMQQRVGLAVALLGSPRLVVLDEPHNGLDPMGVDAVRQIVRDLARQGAAVVLSSHVLGEVQVLCDRVLVMSAGRVVLAGRSDELCRSTAFYLDVRPVDVAEDWLVGLGAQVHTAADGRLVVTGDEGDRARHVRALVDRGLDVLEVTSVLDDLAEVVAHAVRQGDRTAPLPAGREQVPA